ACYVAEKGQAFLLRVPSSPEDAPKETTGAGDAFAAGFLFGLLRGKSPMECGRLGDLVARFAIARTGARAGLPSLEELTQLFRRVYDQPL
ncbi:MAG: PfkB family carbohydrate kinase, partial [Chloroflexota bacterium]|nr:PfkB family carbohydrate kinase [Chloroflexota bacterium]